MKKLLLGLSSLAVVAAVVFFLETHSSGVGQVCVTSTATLETVAHLAPSECVSSSETQLTAPTVYARDQRAWKIIGEFTFWSGLGALTPDCENGVAIPLGRLNEGHYALGQLEFDLPLRDERVCSPAPGS